MAVSCGSWDRCTTLVFSCDRSVSFTHTSGNLPEETWGRGGGGDVVSGVYGGGMDGWGREGGRLVPQQVTAMDKELHSAC